MMLDRRAAFQLEFRSLWLKWITEENSDLLTDYPQYTSEVIARFASKIFFMKTHMISHFSRILDQDDIPSRLARYQEYLRANRDASLRRELEMRIARNQSVLTNAIEVLKQKYLCQ